jgi:DNA-binding XRE family transcriptional regulator
MNRLTRAQLSSSVDFVTAHHQLVAAGVHPLRAARQLRYLSMDQLFQATGISRKTIIRAEQGRALRPETCRLLASYFRMEPWQLGLYTRAQQWEGCHEG